MKNAAKYLIFALLVSLTASPQDEAQWSRMLKDLQTENKAHSASAELLTAAKSNPKARIFLEKNLPLVINEAYRSRPTVWLESVRLAGNLRSSSCVDTLIRHIPAGGGTVTLASLARLDNYPAAKALTQIGEPSIEPLRIALSREKKPQTREIMIRSVGLIATPTAKEVLRKHLDTEKDKELRKLITNLLAGMA